MWRQILATLKYLLWRPVNHWIIVQFFSFEFPDFPNWLYLTWHILHWNIWNDRCPIQLSLGLTFFYWVSHSDGGIDLLWLELSAAILHFIIFRLLDLEVFCLILRDLNLSDGSWSFISDQSFLWGFDIHLLERHLDWVVKICLSFSIWIGLSESLNSSSFTSWPCYLRYWVSSSWYWMKKPSRGALASN